MKKQNDIESIFREGLHNLEANPRPDAWSAIQSGLNSGAVGSTAAGIKAVSSSSWLTTIIGGLFIASIAVGGYFFFNAKGEKQKKKADTELKESIPANNKVADSNAISETPETVIENELETVASNSDNSTEKSITPVLETKTKKGTTKVKVDSPETTEKTIDEIIAESQAQFEANRLEAIRLEEAQSANNTSSSASTGKSTAESKNTSERNVSETSNKKEEDSEQVTINIANEIEFPNAFSPNLDGTNDVFRLAEKYYKDVDQLKVYIYSKTGKVIYEWTSVEGGWDGTFRDGSLAPEGSYFYFATLKKDNKDYQKKGQFNLLR